jgi:pseudouridine synthase
VSRFSFSARTNRLRQSRRQARSSTNACLHFAQQTGWLCLHPAGSKHDRYDLPFAAAEISSLAYVGRLDAQSEGLLVLTNDGDFAQRLTHPRFKVEKEYEVVLDRAATADLAQRLLRGVLLDGKRARAKRVQQISPTRLRIVLEQGINRQIRRMLECFGFHAKKLRRVRLGNLTLHDLPRGKWRHLSVQEACLIPSKSASSTRTERSRRRGSFKVAQRVSSAFARNDDESR